MTVWFTSDTHFGHKNIIGYCNRPFADVDVMTTELIVRWNAVVKPGDLVYFLGDFVFGKNSTIRETTEGLLQELNGGKVFVPGNHDPKEVRKAKGWASVRDTMLYVLPDQTVAVLNHFYEDGKEYPKDWVRLHGHAHGTSPKHIAKIDVGVDCWDYQPVSEDQIVKEFQKRRALVAA